MSDRKGKSQRSKDRTESVGATAYLSATIERLPHIINPICSFLNFQSNRQWDLQMSGREVKKNQYTTQLWHRYPQVQWHTFSQFAHLITINVWVGLTACTCNTHLNVLADEIKIWRIWFYHVCKFASISFLLPAWLAQSVQPFQFCPIMFTVPSPFNRVKESNFQYWLGPILIKILYAISPMWKEISP